MLDGSRKTFTLRVIWKVNGRSFQTYTWVSLCYIKHGLCGPDWAVSTKNSRQSRLSKLLIQKLSGHCPRVYLTEEREHNPRFIIIFPVICEASPLSKNMTPGFLSAPSSSQSEYSQPKQLPHVTFLGWSFSDLRTISSANMWRMACVCSVQFDLPWKFWYIKVYGIFRAYDLWWLMASLIGKTTLNHRTQDFWVFRQSHEELPSAISPPSHTMVAM